jgi:hypothetical protein
VTFLGWLLNLTLFHHGDRLQGISFASLLVHPFEHLTNRYGRND